VLVSSYISPKARKGERSSIDRRGIVALAAIARHEIVAIKGGHIVDSATLAALPEPLTTDYALFDDYDGQMDCRCGTRSCRGVIGGRDWQRPELQERYGNYFSWYLLNKISPR
jgi:hypothetical protein